MNDAPKGSLVIGVTEIFSQYRIPSILMEYKKDTPMCRYLYVLLKIRRFLPRLRTDKLIWPLFWKEMSGLIKS